MDELFFDKVNEKIDALEIELREHHRSVQFSLQMLLTANSKEYKRQLYQVRALRSWVRGLKLESELISVTENQQGEIVRSA